MLSEDAFIRGGDGGILWFHLTSDNESKKICNFFGSNLAQNKKQFQVGISSSLKDLDFLQV